jgi:hypothetical protein
VGFARRWQWQLSCPKLSKKNYPVLSYCMRIDMRGAMNCHFCFSWSGELNGLEFFRVPRLRRYIALVL